MLFWALRKVHKVALHWIPPCRLLLLISGDIIIANCLEHLTQLKPHENVKWDWLSQMFALLDRMRLRLEMIKVQRCDLKVKLPSLINLSSITTTIQTVLLFSTIAHFMLYQHTPVLKGSCFFRLWLHEYLQQFFRCVKIWTASIIAESLLNNGQLLQFEYAWWSRLIMIKENSQESVKMYKWSNNASREIVTKARLRSRQLTSWLLSETQLLSPVLSCLGCHPMYVSLCLE